MKKLILILAVTLFLTSALTIATPRYLSHVENPVIPVAGTTTTTTAGDSIDFTVTLSRSVLIISQGNHAVSNITLHGNTGFSSNVTFSAMITGPSSSLSVHFSSNSIRLASGETQKVTLTISTTSTTTAGIYSITITSTTGHISKNVLLQVIVESNGNNHNNSGSDNSTSNNQCSGAEQDDQGDSDHHHDNSKQHEGAGSQHEEDRPQGPHQKTSGISSDCKSQDRSNGDVDHELKSDDSGSDDSLDD